MRWKATALLLGGIGYLVSWHAWEPRAPVVVPASRPATTTVTNVTTSGGSSVPVAPSTMVSPTMSVTTVGSMTIAAQWTSPTMLPAGLPASVQITITQQGQPVTDWFPQTSNGWMWANPNQRATATGQWVGQFTQTTAGTVQPTVPILLPPTTTGTDITVPAVTVTLPPITFTAPNVSAVAHSDQSILPSAWWINQAWDAWPVIDAATHAPTIAVLTNGRPDTAAINRWLATQGLPPLTVTVAPGFTVASHPSAGAQVEITTDLTAVGIAAPGATVVLYPFTDQSFSTAFEAALANPNIATVSISYTTPVATWPWAEQQALWQPWDAAVTAANARGTTVFVPAGDQGATSTATGAETSAFSLLATLPNVTVVGGVDWTATRAGTQRRVAYWGGTVYSSIASGILQTRTATPADQGHLLGGGGTPNFDAEPPWQSAVIPQLPGRGTPDLSGPASRNFPQIDPTIAGTSTLLGGTSFATPLMAGWLAECGADTSNHWGNLNPALYALAGQRQVFESAAFGNNGTTAVTANPWNALIGLGAPYIAPLCQALTAAASSGPVKPITTSPAKLAPTPQVTIQVTSTHRIDTVCAHVEQQGHPIGGIPLTLTTRGFPLDIGYSSATPSNAAPLPQFPGASALSNGNGSACWSIYPPAKSQSGSVQVQAAGQSASLSMPTATQVAD